MVKDLISVIVPIYNVEKYLKKSIESIINQTYNNLEIILVDDGSKDNSGVICDEYQKLDSRIKVIHKKNAGVSSARNVGLKIANGEYIGFIDPDDYVAKEMFEVLYNNIKETNSDMSICTYEILKGQTIVKVYENNNEVKVFSKMEALKELLLGNITSHQWNKLYKAELFDSIIFPEGKIMEDIAVMPLLIEKSNKIVYQYKPLYYYVKRDSSILGNINKELIVTLEETINKKNCYLKSKYKKDLEKYIDLENFKFIKIYFDDIVICKDKQLLNSNKFKKYYKLYKILYKKYKKEIKILQKGNVKRLEYHILYAGNRLYWIYYSLKNKIKRCKK